MWSKIRNLLQPPADRTDADAAVDASRMSLRIALSRDQEVSRTAAELRYHRVEVNHMAERIKASLREA